MYIYILYGLYDFVNSYTCFGRVQRMHLRMLEITMEENTKSIFILHILVFLENVSTRLRRIQRNDVTF